MPAAPILFGLAHGRRVTVFLSAATSAAKFVIDSLAGTVQLLRYPGDGLPGAEKGFQLVPLLFCHVMLRLPCHLNTPSINFSLSEREGR